MTALVAITLLLPFLAAAGCAVTPSGLIATTSRALTPAVAGCAAVLAGIVLTHPERTFASRLVLVDAGGAVFIGVIAVVGAGSALLSDRYLATLPRSVAGDRQTTRVYYVALHSFWGLLLAVPMSANLGVAWLLIEATTAASALLVAFSAKRTALEAGWKYLVLTTLGLTVALLGIVMLHVSAAGGALDALDWSNLPQTVGRADHDTAVVSLVLIMTGLATKIGWAPVHHWLPDAHSEAPAPVSALLSAALLPTVLLVAWRVTSGFEPALGPRPGETLLIGFGLASLAVAVPFLWRPLPWKRLLAYSSLEHMGVIALGVGFRHPVAIAGVVAHVVGHALAKSLAFWISGHVLAVQPQTARVPPSGLARSNPPIAAAFGVSLGTLAGLPPSPLFASEVLVLWGGARAGHMWVAGVAAALLALGFIGLAQTTLRGLAGPRRRASATPAPRWVAPLTAATLVALLAVTVTSVLLPDSAVIDAVTRGAR